MGVRNIFSRPGGCRTNNFRNKNFYVYGFMHIISTFVNMTWNPIVLSLWPLSFSVIYCLFYSRSSSSIGYGRLGWVWVGLCPGSINSPGSGLGWVWVDSMDPWTTLQWTGTHIEFFLISIPQTPDSQKHYKVLNVEKFGCLATAHALYGQSADKTNLWIAEPQLEQFY